MIGFILPTKEAMSLEYWNHYRPHAELNGNMVLPYQQDADGEIQEISFLGGLLHGYRRVKQAA